MGFFKRIKDLFRKSPVGLPKPPKSYPIPKPPKQPETPKIQAPSASQAYDEKQYMLVAEAKKWLWVREHGTNRGKEVEMFQREVDGKAI